MNKSKIEWCDSTWNPVTGCLHGCTYCYAERIAKRFSKNSEANRKLEEIFNNEFGISCPKGLHELGGSVVVSGEKDPYPYEFEPTFHRYRLQEPSTKTKPQNIFVCSMADLFGEWVPEEWINDIYMACQKADWHRYLFLTKNPKKYRVMMRSNLDYRYYMWFGTTVNTQKDLTKYAIDIMNLPGNLFLSVEPLHGWIDLTRIETTDGNGYWNALTGETAVPFTILQKQKIRWVIIGAESGPGANKNKPCMSWVIQIINQCKYAGVPVFMKDNLVKALNLKGTEIIKEFPW